MEKGYEHQLDDDGCERRVGTVYTATAHIVTAVIGSGVLALAWSVAQLGWGIGPLVLLGFSFVTYYASVLLADCYRSPDGTRNLTYKDAVGAYLGPREVFTCGLVQYGSLWATLVGYTLTAAISMMAVKRSNCYHKNGHAWHCGVSGNMFMILFGLIEIGLSQLPSMENLTWLSVVAAVMSFGYATIGLGLCMAKWISHGQFRGNLIGVIAAQDVTSDAKLWRVLQAVGNIAFAYTFAEVLIEIQDTLRSPPAENKTMRRATLYGIGITAIFYISIGCVGYAAFGGDAPGNMLTGFGFYEPFWLVDIANLFIVVHLIGAYQVFAQPIFGCVEGWIASKWSDKKLIHVKYKVKLPFSKAKTLNFSLLKLLFRSLFVIFTTLVAMLFPFFNAILGLIGSIGFWPLTVFFPVRMCIVQKNIERGTPRWLFLQALSFCCLLVSLAASIGSIADIAESLKHAAPFKAHY